MIIIKLYKYQQIIRVKRYEVNNILNTSRHLFIFQDIFIFLVGSQSFIQNYLLQFFLFFLPFMSELRDSLLGQKKKLDTFQKIYQDCINRIKRIKQKNDTLQKNTGTDQQDQIAREVRKQKQYMENQISQLKDQLNEMQKKYRDTESKIKIKGIKAEAQKQIQRNKLILKEFINKSFLIVQNVRRSRGDADGDQEDQNKYFEGGKNRNIGGVNNSSVNESMNNDDYAYQNQKRRNDGKPVQRVQKNIQAQIQIDYEIQRKILDEKSNLLNQVEQDTYKINDIMNQIGVLIQEQGDNIDIVTDNVLETNKNVIQATENIEQASDLQKKAKKKYIVITIIILICIALVIGVVFILKK